MAKYLDFTGLSYLANKLKTQCIPTESHQYATVPKDSPYSVTVTGYANGKSLVEVYLNGLRMIPDKEYTLSASGVMALKSVLNTDGNTIHIVHKKWR